MLDQIEVKTAAGAPSPGHSGLASYPNASPSTLADEGPLDGGRTAVIVLEGRGRVGLWNLASDRLLRRAAGDAVGESILSIQIPNLPEHHLQLIRQAAVAKIPLRLDGLEGSWSRIAVLPLGEGRVAIVLHAT